MELKTEIPRVAAELARAVELTMDPNIPQQQRNETYAACERFKETSPLCAECGLYLAQESSASHIVQHFGLQLVEHCIKYRWNQMTQLEKLHIKENALKLLRANIPHLQQYSHIKDALSRVIVEMVKREWPQQWQTLLPELSTICTGGPTQTEVVLLIFLRLVEDVAVLQTLESNQRRKDIYQALNSNMADIFSFFLELMNKHFSAYNMYISQGNAIEVTVHSRVVHAVLVTLSSFLDWVSVHHIMANNGELLHIFCLLVCNEFFRVAAADCLLQILSRKGRVEDRKPLLILFHDEGIRCLTQATNSLCVTPDEDLNMFLKKFVQVVTSLGSQLCTIWTKEETCPPISPVNFKSFLEILLILMQHPSITAVHLTNTLWINFFKHEQILKDVTFTSIIPKWIHLVGLRLVKPSFPITRHSGTPETVAFALMDFESDDDYVVLYHRARTEILECFRLATPVYPLLTFQFIEEWLTNLLEKSKLDSTVMFPANMALFLQWEALSQVSESILSKILLSNERPEIHRGLKLLENCLTFDPQDPLILSLLLSSVSSLFVFLSMSPVDSRSSVLLLGVLNKIFSSLTFTIPGENKKSRAVKSLRRHGACLLVRISVKYPLLLLPFFDKIYSSVQAYCVNTETLTQMERSTVLEALFLISNNFCDYDRQLSIVADVVRPCVEQWLLLVQETFQSAQHLIKFVGLNESPESCTEATALNRVQITYCLMIFASVVKRCAWPEDPDRAARGGFVIAHTESGNPIYRNPATPVILPVLPGVITFIKTFSKLYVPDSLQMFSESYKKAHSMMDIDRNVLLGINQSTFLESFDTLQEKVTPPLEKMQQFLNSCSENCFTILGYACSSLGREFYQLDYLAPRIVDSVLINLQHIPDHRLRPAIKTFLKQLVWACPQAYYESVIVPVCTHFCPYMFVRLSTKWQQLTPVNEDTMDNDTEGTQEVIDDILTRALTREYLDVLKCALTGASSIEIMNCEAMDQDMEGNETSRTNTTALQTAVISELGSLLLSNPACCHSIVLCVLSALSWQDTATSAKATGMVGPIVRHLANKEILNEQLSLHIMTCVLQGLQLHGQHEGNSSTLLTLGVQMYELLRPKFPNVVEVFTLIPSFSAHDVQKLDEKILVSSQKNNKIEKCKKDIFRRLTSQLIGRSMGQLFRKEVHIADLPRIPVSTACQKPEVDYVNLCQLFS